MKPLIEYINEAYSIKVFFTQSVFEGDFEAKIKNNTYNKNYPALKGILSGGKLFSSMYHNQIGLWITNNDDLTFQDDADFTGSITFSMPKSKRNGPITPKDLKVKKYPASWGSLNEYGLPNCVEACKVLTCLFYNRYNGKDIDIPGIE